MFFRETIDLTAFVKLIKTLMDSKTWTFKAES